MLWIRLDLVRLPKRKLGYKSIQRHAARERLRGALHRRRLQSNPERVEPMQFLLGEDDSKARLLGGHAAISRRRTRAGQQVPRSPGPQVRTLNLWAEPIG